MPISIWPFNRRKKAAKRTAEAAPKVAVPSKRISAPNTFAEGAPPQPFNKSVIPILRAYAIADEDVAGAVRDLVVLANPGFRIVVTGKQAEAAQADLLSVVDSWSPFGSLDALVDNQIIELIVAGASSVEWYPTKARDGVAGAAVIPHEQVEVVVNPDGSVQYFQNAIGSRVELNPTTYYYIPNGTIANSRVGVPLIYAALAPLRRKDKMLASIDKILEILGLAGIIHAAVPLPNPIEEGFSGETDPEWHEYVRRLLQNLAELLQEAQSTGTVVTPAGTEVNIISPSRDLSMASTAWIDNEFRVWSGSRTMPFMRGRSETLSETWARVVYPVILAEAKNLANIVKKQIEFGLNLHLRLRGYMATASLEFFQPESPFKEQDGRALYYASRADEVYATLFGDSWIEKRKRELGLQD